MYRYGLILLCGWLASVTSVGAADFKWQLRTATAPPKLPPVPSVSDSPVKYLADLLGASEDRRTTMLERHSAARQAFWLRKVAEYERLPESFRQARLRTAQLHWYLALMIRLPADLRLSKLVQIPESDRVLVKRRLEQWETLPADLQNDIVNNIKVMQYFARLISSSPAQRQALLKTSAEPSNPMNDESLSWQSLTSQRRQAMFDAYAKFFELPRMKQEEAVAKLPVPARKQLMERVDELFKLPLEERQKCLIALNVYARMSPEERSIFRGNAERWRAMDADERSFWTIFVKQLPPLPPMLGNRLGAMIPREAIVRREKAEISGQ